MLNRQYSFLLLLCLLLSAGVLGAQSLFWEEPRILVENRARFPSVATGGGLIAIVWQEFVTPEQGDGGEVYLSVLTSRDARSWQRNDRFSGPYIYQDRQVPIFSLAVDGNGRIYLALAGPENATTILRSNDEGKSFDEIAVLPAGATAVAPILSITATGSLLLFITREIGEFLALYFAVSRNGSSWSGFEPFVTDPQLPINFLPRHISYRGREYVVFQTISRQILDRKTGLNYQLYLKSSDNGGSSWGAGKSLSFGERVQGSFYEPDFFSNQRAHLVPLNGNIAIAWERQFLSAPPQIYYVEIDRTGTMTTEPERISEGFFAAHFPKLLVMDGQVNLFWFDNRTGEDHIYVAEKQGFRWTQSDISDITGVSRFALPIVVQDKLFVFWENRRGETAHLMYLEPDQTVAQPLLKAVNFNPLVAAKQDSVRIRWNVPQDSSGISGFNYIWTQNKNQPVPRELSVLADVTSADLTVAQEGTWYFRLAAEDYAGNWSEPVSIAFTQDITPPNPPVIRVPEADDQGYLLSNTYTLSWTPAPGEQTVRYSYDLSYLGSEQPENVPVPETLPRTIFETELSIDNQDNGYWLFSLSAVDEAGNISEASTELVALNKYIPVTYISTVRADKNPVGNLDVRITGRGFSEGGNIRQILLDRDGEAPFDYQFDRSLGFYRVRSDRIIDGLTLEDIEEGLYQVGVVHPVRGTYFTQPILQVESQGVVKFGNFNLSLRTPWDSAYTPKFIAMDDVLLWLVIALLAVILLVSVRKLASLAREGQILRTEILAVIKGD